MAPDLDELKKLHIEARYELNLDINDPHVRGIFAFRPAAVLYAAVAASHKRSSKFAEDVRKVLKRWRKQPCQTAVELEVLLWDTCQDRALRCPWRPEPVQPLRIITNHMESEDSWKERVAGTRAEWLRLMQELCDAMNGKRQCEVVVVKPNPSNN